MSGEPSLKAKRAAIRPIVDGLRHRFHVRWPRSTTRTRGSGRRSASRSCRARSDTCRSMLDSVERFVATRPTSSCSTSRSAGWRPSHDVAAQVPADRAGQRVVLEVLADELERLSDPRLELVTITGVDVSRDLAHAKVFYSTLGAETTDTTGNVAAGAAAGLDAASAHLRRVVGRQLRIRQVPALTSSSIRASSPGSASRRSSAATCPSRPTRTCSEHRRRGKSRTSTMR